MTDEIQKRIDELAMVSTDDPDMIWLISKLRETAAMLDAYKQLHKAPWCDGDEAEHIRIATEALEFYAGLKIVAEQINGAYITRDSGSEIARAALEKIRGEKL